MKTTTGARLLAVGGLLVAGVMGAGAQALFQVTGQSRAGAAALEAPDGGTRSLATGDEVVGGTLKVDAAAQLMMLAEGGVVVVLLGPATLVLRGEELAGGIRAELQQGKLLCVATAAAIQGQPILFATPSAGGRAAVEFRASPGWTYLACDATQVAVGYVGEPSASLTVSVAGTPRAVASGQYLRAAAGAEPELQALGPWLQAEGFDAAWGRNLGVESARAARKLVEANLFTNIIEWDRYAGAAYVGARLQEWRFNPEIRQTVESVSAPARLTGRGAQPQTVPFAGANAVPLFSPAGAAVQNLRNVGQGVTAVQLNSQAADFLQRTGSRGLGFRGLEQLALPAFLNGGVRSPTPAGLGGQR